MITPLQAANLILADYEGSLNAESRLDIKGCQSAIVRLPGNPLSGYVCTIRLASRLIARLRGEPLIERWREAKLLADLPANGPREFMLPARLEGTNVEPLAWKGSADVFTLARDNALIVRAENEAAKPAGSMVRLLEV